MEVQETGFAKQPPDGVKQQHNALMPPSGE